MKGLSIQTQQNTFVLFTLFKLTSDERKTLTKISMRKTSHNHSPNQRTLRTRRNKKTSKQPNKGKEEKAVCTTGKTAAEDTDPTHIIRFLGMMTNSEIARKITQKGIPEGMTLGQAFT